MNSLISAALKTGTSSQWARFALKFGLFCLTFCLFTLNARAQAEDITQDDTYDPFADYSEFEASEDEEADIHFFKNGRFFNLGFMFGGRVFTQKLGELYKPAPAYGVNIVYFFDIRTAIQVSYTHSEHDFTLANGSHPITGDPYNGFNGNVSLSNVAAHMKYYFNTANITRGFADLNPYIIGGFSVNYRNITIVGEDVIVKNSPTGIDVGFGLEVPIARNKMYLGIQGMYHYVKFPDENAEIFADTEPTGIIPRGDYGSVFMILGINF